MLDKIKNIFRWQYSDILLAAFILTVFIYEMEFFYRIYLFYSYYNSELGQNHVGNNYFTTMYVAAFGIIGLGLSSFYLTNNIKNKYLITLLAGLMGITAFAIYSFHSSGVIIKYSEWATL